MAKIGKAEEANRLSLRKVIEDKDMCYMFAEYLYKIHSLEALEFFIEVELFKRITDIYECIDCARRIYQNYIQKDSTKEINVEGTLRTEISENINRNHLDQNVFCNVQKSVEGLLQLDAIQKFTKFYSKQGHGWKRSLKSAFFRKTQKINSLGNIMENLEEYHAKLEIEKEEQEQKRKSQVKRESFNVLKAKRKSCKQQIMKRYHSIQELTKLEYSHGSKVLSKHSSRKARESFKPHNLKLSEDDFIDDKTDWSPVEFNGRPKSCTL